MAYYSKPKLLNLAPKTSQFGCNPPNPISTPTTIQYACQLQIVIIHHSSKYPLYIFISSLNLK